MGDTREKLLLFGGLPMAYLREWEITADLGAVESKLHVCFDEVGIDELRAAYERAVQRAEARERAEQLLAEASEAPAGAAVCLDELQKATALYLAIRAILDDLGGDAVSFHCGAFRQNPGYPVPCVALTLVQDDGFPAVCQGDIDALLTMVLFRRASGRPGFMGGGHERDGRLGVVHDQMSRKMAGPEGPLQPFYMAGHHSNPDSPAIHTDLPSGEPVTVARLTRNAERLLLASGTLVDCVDQPGSCQNTLIIEVGDLPRLMEQVKGGQYHLVVGLGDYAAELSEMAEARGIRVARA